jgi:hypothetical protein
MRCGTRGARVRGAATRFVWPREQRLSVESAVQGARWEETLAPGSNWDRAPLKNTSLILSA